MRPNWEKRRTGGGRRQLTRRPIVLSKDFTDDSDSPEKTGGSLSEVLLEEIHEVLAVGGQREDRRVMA